MGEVSEEAMDQARLIIQTSATTSEAIGRVGVALQRHIDLYEHADASWKRAATLSVQLEIELAKMDGRVKELAASKAALIADVEDWMSDALLELPHDAIDLSRILDKHRGQP